MPGSLLKVASEVAYSFDVGVGDTFCWITDMGWIMGPLAAFGTHANGATLLLYEGSPDVPGHLPAVGSGAAAPYFDARGVPDADPGAEVDPGRGDRQAGPRLGARPRLDR